MGSLAPGPHWLFFLNFCRVTDASAPRVQCTLQLMIIMLAGRNESLWVYACPMIVLRLTFVPWINGWIDVACSLYADLLVWGWGWSSTKAPTLLLWGRFMRHCDNIDPIICFGVWVVWNNYGACTGCLKYYGIIANLHSEPGTAQLSSAQLICKGNGNLIYSTVNDVA